MRPARNLVAGFAIGVFSGASVYCNSALVFASVFFYYQPGNGASVGSTSFLFPVTLFEALPFNNTGFLSDGRRDAR